MRKIDRLKKEALECCKHRDHDMRRFKTMDDHREVSTCKRCNMFVRVDMRPLPGDTDIMGNAVALTCISDDQKLIRDLWYAIENGTVGEQFNQLRTRVRNSYNNWS